METRRLFRSSLWLLVSRVLLTFAYYYSCQIPQRILPQCSLTCCNILRQSSLSLRTFSDTYHAWHDIRKILVLHVINVTSAVKTKLSTKTVTIDRSHNHSNVSGYQTSSLPHLARNHYSTCIDQKVHCNFRGAIIAVHIYFRKFSVTSVERRKH